MMIRQYKHSQLQTFRGLTAAMMLGLLYQGHALADPLQASFKPLQPDSKPLQPNLKPLRLGLLPFLTPSVLIKKFHPMIEYLETTQERPVIVTSAPDFETYISRIEQGKYDLFLAAPHISAYTEQHYNSKRLAGFKRQSKGYFVVHKDSNIYSIKQLKNRTLAMPDPLAIISLLGEWTLVENSLRLDHDVIRHYTTHDNALLLVANGRQDAAVVGVSSFDHASNRIKSKLRVLTETAVVPHMMFHSRADLTEPEYQKLKDAMLKFTAQGAGKDFFANAAFGDLTPITDQEIIRLTKLVKLLEDRLD